LDNRASLANISFRWMLHEIQSIDNCGVIFDDDALDRMEIPIDCVPRRSRDGSDDSSQETRIADQIVSWEKMDDTDIETAMHDELKIHPWWWLLQIPTLNGGR
jgi:hypothetical protein